MDHAHLVGMDAQDLVRDLRQGRLHALAVAVHPHAHFQHAIGTEPDIGLLEARHEGNAPGVIDRRAMRALLAEGSKAEAHRLARGLARADRVEIEGRHRAAKRLGIIAAVEHLAHQIAVRHRVRRHEIGEPDRLRRDAELARQGVERGLHGVAHAGPRHAAIGQDRRLVGAGRDGVAAQKRQDVGARQDRADLRRFQAGAERVGRVGAGIDRGFTLHAQKLAGAVGPRRDDIVMLAAVGAGRELLITVFQPAHRTAEQARDAGADDLLGQQDALVAEAAADVGRDDAHLAFVEAEAIGQAALGDVRHLGRGGDDHLLEPGIPFG